MQHGHASPAYKTGTSGAMGGSLAAQGMGGMGIASLAEVMLNMHLSFKIFDFHTSSAHSG